MNLSDQAPEPREIWHPYWVLEETQSPMWGAVKDRQAWLRRAVEFTGDAELYGRWMLCVLTEWPKSCEHNLSKSGDKRAWIGHAAVAIAIGCPEDIVRQAWPMLTDAQRLAANDKAQAAINMWRAEHAKKSA